MAINNEPTVKVSGQLFWTRDMTTLATAFNTATSINDKFFCTLGCLSDKDVQALAQIGVIARSNEKYPEQGMFIKSKSKYKFEPKDENGVVLDVAELGNGTKAVAGVSTYNVKVAGKSITMPSIKYITVKEVVTYVPETKEEELDDVL